MTALPKHHCANFDTLARAFADGSAALVDCTDIATGEQVPAICAVEFDGTTYTLKPFARLFTGNPYEELLPPGAERPAPDSVRHSKIRVILEGGIVQRAETFAGEQVSIEILDYDVEGHDPDELERDASGRSVLRYTS